MRHGLSCAFLALLFCAGCGGGGSHTMLPVASASGTRLSPQSVATGPALLQINAGGPATSGFSTDQFFVGYSGANSDNQPVDVSASGSAPQAVYATYRTAPKALTYSVTGLAPYGTYTGELNFEEPLLGGVGRRVMNVSVGGVTLVTGLDIFALTGATHKAYNMPIVGTATAAGTLDIVLTATANDTIISGFSLQPATVALGPVDLLVNAGGPATGAFAGDRNYVGYSGTNADTNPIDVSAPNVAPAAVYASYRTAPTSLIYNFGDLAPNATYRGFLYFEEPLLGGIGRRVQTITANYVVVAQDLDIFKIAGKTHKAIAVPITTVVDGTGTLTLEIDATVNDAIISGIELHERVAPIPTPSASATPGTPISGIFTRFAPINGTFVAGIAAGPDGGMWFTENGAPDIGRITTGGTITNFPTAKNVSPWAIVNGPDGALWFTDLGTNAIGRITIAGAITEFPIAPPQADPLSIAAGSDGALWFTENDRIGRMTTAGAYSDFAVPTVGSGPESITAGPDGALWFTEESAGKIGRITTSGAITEYTALSNVFRQNVENPIGIAAGPDGALWFGDVGTNSIGRITTAGTIVELPVPNGFPDYLTAGPDGAMYLANGPAIDRVSLAGVVTNTYPIPLPGSAALSIALGPDGALWLGEQSPAAIERLH
jgi:virginiamycin B lyase